MTRVVADDSLVFCERLSARFLPGFCRRYREKNAVCNGCPQAVEMDRLADGLPPFCPPRFEGGAEFGKRSKGDLVGKKPIRACAVCGKERVIQGRGKCGSCYHKELRDERAPQAPVSVADVPVERLSDEEAMRPLTEVVEAPSVADIRQALSGVVAEMPARGDFQGLLDAVLSEVREMLLAKNRAYGNSALDPVRIFSRANPVEQIRVRLDDKISRLMRGADAGEDTELDLLGYLILLRVAMRGPA